jgi:1,2-dihydroxy-3-keto-5-methylthiopentene dioxygenase
MRAYYFDNVPGDQRLLHDSGKPVSDEDLRSIGVLHWHIPTDKQSQIEAVAEERSYKNRDIITITKEGLGDLYEIKLKNFYEEYVIFPQGITKLSNNIRHMHEDEEIRYILEGSGFFDVRGE